MTLTVYRPCFIKQPDRADHGRISDQDIRICVESPWSASHRCHPPLIGWGWWQHSGLAELPRQVNGRAMAVAARRAPQFLHRGPCPLPYGTHHHAQDDTAEQANRDQYHAMSLLCRSGYVRLLVDDSR
jgi:hypothetical protein